jgi:hypothetical protein
VGSFRSRHEFRAIQVHGLLGEGVELPPWVQTAINTGRMSVAMKLMPRRYEFRRWDPQVRSGFDAVTTSADDWLVEHENGAIVLMPVASFEKAFEPADAAAADLMQAEVDPPRPQGSPDAGGDRRVPRFDPTDRRLALEALAVCVAAYEENGGFPLDEEKCINAATAAKKAIAALTKDARDRDYLDDLARR